jgi:hypothetical protein
MSLLLLFKQIVASTPVGVLEGALRSATAIYEGKGSSSGVIE